jgi:hypothetical protein
VRNLQLTLFTIPLQLFALGWSRLFLTQASALRKPLLAGFHPSTLFIILLQAPPPPVHRQRASRIPSEAHPLNHPSHVRSWHPPILPEQAVGGLINAMVIKYAGNMPKIFAAGAALAVTSLVSMELFAFRPHSLFWVGMVTVVCATLLFSIHEKDGPGGSGGAGGAHAIHPGATLAEDMPELTPSPVSSFGKLAGSPIMTPDSLQSRMSLTPVSLASPMIPASFPSSPMPQSDGDMARQGDEGSCNPRLRGT